MELSHSDLKPEMRAQIEELIRSMEDYSVVARYSLSSITITILLVSVVQATKKLRVTTFP